MARHLADRLKWPLAPLNGTIAPFLPVVAILGLLASVLEGAGIGLFIPLLAVLMSESVPPGIPEPIRSLASLFAGYDPQTRVVLLGAAIFALILLKSVVQAASQCLVVWIEGRVGAEIRNGLANRLLSADYSFFLKNDPVRLTRILSTDSWFVLQATRALLALIPAAAGLLVFGVLLAMLNLRLFAIAALGAVIVLAGLYFAERSQRRLSTDFTASHHRLWERFITLLEAPRVIRLFGQQRRERESVARATEELRQRKIAGDTQPAIVHPIVDAAVALLFIIILLAGYWSGTSIPEITAFVLLLTRAQPHAKAISQARLAVASFHGPLREVDWLLSQHTAPLPEPSGSSAFRLDRPIAFDNVAYSYPDGTRALEGVTVAIEPGVATAILGPSGSGKTTLVNLLCRLIEPQGGEIHHGKDRLAAIPLETWRDRIAVTGQDSELVIGTVAENIAYGRPEAARVEIENAATAAGAHKFIMDLPQGYDTRLGPDGFSLSGGQRQRIALARAVLRHPDLLILDEATSAVDALTEAEIMTLIAEHRHFRTMLVISHRKTTITACDQGIVLDNGTVAEAGPLPNLRYFKEMAGPLDRAHG